MMQNNSSITQNVTTAMLQMKKIEIDELKRVAASYSKVLSAEYKNQ
jgi:hypothetical protein